MADHFRKLYLEHIKAVIKKDANKESLEELLKIASPKLSEEQLMTPAIRGAAFQLLRNGIHPVYHVSERDTAAILHRDVTDFYARCCANLTRTPRAKRQKTSTTASPTGVNEFPQDFCIEDKWGFLDDIPPKVVTVSEAKLPALMAARCINARGAIAHGRKTEISYVMDDLYKDDEGNSVVDFFKRKGGGSKVLDTVDEIKEELTKRGPVVSTSFVPSKEFVSTSAHKSAFLKKRVGKPHELLIIGWKLTPTGEVWLVKPLRGESIIQLAFGQFAVDDVVMAPESSFQNEHWQEGPYAFGSQTEWASIWSGAITSLTAGELQTFAIDLRDW